MPDRRGEKARSYCKSVGTESQRQYQQGHDGWCCWCAARKMQAQFAGRAIVLMAGKVMVVLGQGEHLPCQHQYEHGGNNSARTRCKVFGEHSG